MTDTYRHSLGPLHSLQWSASVLARRLSSVLTWNNYSVLICSTIVVIWHFVSEVVATVIHESEPIGVTKFKGHSIMTKLSVHWNAIISQCIQQFISLIFYPSMHLHSYQQLIDLFNNHSIRLPIDQFSSLLTDANQWLLNDWFAGFAYIYDLTTAYV